MLGKVVNGRLVIPSEAERQKIVIANPSDESLKFNLGYKDFMIDEKPTYDKATQMLKPVFEETETIITQHWEVVDISTEVQTEPNTI